MYMQNSPGPNNFSLDKLQNMVLNKCGSFFKKKYRDSGHSVCMCIRTLTCFTSSSPVCIDWSGIIDYVMKPCQLVTSHRE